MVKVICTCRYCSTELSLPPSSVTVRTWQNRPDLAVYEFRCMQCGQENSKPATAEVLAKLTPEAVVRLHTVLPEELDDPVRAGGCRDDLLNALIELQGEITCPNR